MFFQWKAQFSIHIDTMSALFVMCVCGRNKIPQNNPHQRCLQCLGLDHPYDLCPECTSVHRSVKARRALQLKAWRATGQFMSRAKSAAYFKQMGNMEAVRTEISASFSTTVNESQILSGNVKGPLIGYGPGVSGAVEHQLFSEPAANSSTIDSQVWDDQSTLLSNASIANKSSAFIPP